MNEKKYFSLRETPYRPGWYVLEINFEELPQMNTTGSYGVLPARLMNISYPQYIRMCRDVLGAEVIGKNKAYPIVYFKKNLNTSAFIRLLNSRMYCVLWEREHPDWEEHQEYIKKKKEEKKNVFNS